MEIGPGLGALTNFALERSRNGTLIEKDDRLIGFLEERYPDLRVVHQDACEFDTRTLLPGGPLKIFGNLPYYVSSQILFNFTAVTCPATLMLFTLQKELAERIAADPGGKDFGGPTLLIGRRWKVRLLRTLPGSVARSDRARWSRKSGFRSGPDDSAPARRTPGVRGRPL